MLPLLRRLRGTLSACGPLLAGLLSAPLAAADGPIRLTIQPIQTAEATASFHRPLIGSLRAQTGLPIELAKSS
jgi:hypothetical protein